ncbi:MAG: hypothetical protein ACJ74O_02145 [Frankiaceae bacterium]
MTRAADGALRPALAEPASGEEVRERLAEPWELLAGTLARAVAALGLTGATLPVSAAGRSRAARVAERFAACRELDDVAGAVGAAVEMVVGHVERLQRRAAALDVATALAAPSPVVHRERLGDLFLETRALIAGAAPVLGRLWPAVHLVEGDDWPGGEAYDVARVPVFALSPLHPA